MAKVFNVTGLCLPEKHYMADVSDVLQQMIKMVDDESYFTINRARQFGKTTMLELLRRKLAERYLVLALSFEGMGAASFTEEEVFVRDFMEFEILPELERQEEILADIFALCRDFLKQENKNLARLSNVLLQICRLSDRPVVMIIDEVDSASNHQVFLDFLAILRSQYLKRNRTPSFQSVVLAGLYDIKNLQVKIRPAGEHKYNSPWNIAVPFLADMSLNADKIRKMLSEYEKDYHTHMDLEGMSRLIYEYTSGYPYLVSGYCKLLDEHVAGTEEFPKKADAWTKEGFLRANQILLNEQSPLFDDMVKKLEDCRELKDMITGILFYGNKCAYNSDNFSVNIGIMFGFLKREKEYAVIANRVFETRLYNWLLSEMKDEPMYKAGEAGKNRFVVQGKLQMRLVMEGFCRHFTSIFTEKDERFIEEQGRKIFLMYLRPIINGTGNYYIEAQTRDNRRTDIVVDYQGIQEIIELKIWHGDEYNCRGEEQLCGYLKEYGKDRGYLVSFNFNKNKTVGIQEICCNGKKIIEVMV